MNNTSIEWTDTTWNPVRGCSRVSEGCRNCYAEKMAARFSDKGMPYEGLAMRNPARWTGKVRVVGEHLEDPLKWQKPRRIFVNSMSDLFHEDISITHQTDIFEVMAKCPQHTFQILTKRAGMLFRMKQIGVGVAYRLGKQREPGFWPLPNVWLGVSVEDQKTADERIPLLLETPAAVRFISAEPLLGPLDLGAVKVGCGWRSIYCACSPNSGCDHATLDWVITGGESGPGARQLNVEWVRSVIEQCKSASVPCFVKQLGARPYDNRSDEPEVPPYEFYLSNRKGGDMEEWPEELRVRQFPAA